MPAQLFIVARRYPELYDYLSARFADDANVAVVLDRRLGPRRRRALPAAAERRRAERRARPDVDEQLRATSLAVVTAPKTASAPGGPAAAGAPLEGSGPAREARQWVESMQHGVQAVRGVLDDHERLQREAAAVQREHERLQHEAQALRRENEWFRAEVDRWWKELAELDASLGRAIAVVTDLQSRLHKEPPAEPSR
jgi:FtsZ-binding cell division protein ZapB